MADYILSNDGELMHYGVKGMKWGVRKASYTKGPSRKERKERTKQEALEFLRKDKETADKKAKYNSKKSDIAINKAADLEQEAEEVFTRATSSKDYKKIDTLITKSRTADDEAQKYYQEANYWLNKSKILDKRISDIEKGKLKAGKDYVTDGIDMWTADGDYTYIKGNQVLYKRRGSWRTD